MKGKMQESGDNWAPKTNQMACSLKVQWSALQSQLNEAEDLQTTGGGSALEQRPYLTNQRLGPSVAFHILTSLMQRLITA
jgi:hypothetical protein